MLQQTQVTTVIPYYKRFLKTFPNLKALATNKQDTVLHLWSGLGYYARARNLHACAKIIYRDYAGCFPSTIEALQNLPGIGRSTAGAILSFAMQTRAPILDGNVKRVFIRFHAIQQLGRKRPRLFPLLISPARETRADDDQRGALHCSPLDSPAPLSPLQAAEISYYAKKDLWPLVEHYLPQQNFTHYNQALMDIGSLICTRTKPKCNICPLQKHCEAFKQNLTDVLPLKKKPKILPIKKTYLLIIINNKQEILLEQRAPVGIWGGLWSFPECDKKSNIAINLQKLYGLKVNSKKSLLSFRHTFSHFHLDITPIVVTTQSISTQVMENKPIIWHNPHKTFKHGLPQPITRLLKYLRKGVIA